MSDIYLQITETPTVVTLSAPVVASVMVNTVTVANVVSVNVVTMPSISVQAPSVTTVIGTVTVGLLPSLTNNTNFVTVGQQIAQGINAYGTIPIAADWQNANQGIGNLNVTATCVTSTNRIGVVTIGGGTVTIGAGTAQIGSVTASISGTVPVSGTFWQSTQPVSGTFFQATQPVSLTSTTVTVSSLPALVAGTAQIGSVTASISGTVPVSGTFWQATQPVSGTVTANTGLTQPLTDTQLRASPVPIRPRNGAITVTAGSTSSSTNTSTQALASNASRQYLLIQNVSDTDMYFNFGATATTDHLFIAKSGGGIVFESGFVPTDAVNVICSAASKKFYILSS